MTLQEAVRSLQKDAETLDRMRAVFKDQEAEALVNNQMRALDIAIDCIKKQIPYKPSTDGLKVGVGRCKCGAEFLDKTTAYCGNCGQRLDWGIQGVTDLDAIIEMGGLKK